MGQRLILSEEEKRTIQKMYGLINEQTATGCTEGDCVNGRGTYVYKSGSVYKGEFVDDKKNGSGTFTYANGDSYVGEFVDGKRHGEGIFTWINGERYIGEWVDDKRNGYGAYYYSNGDIYEGEYENSKRNGKGTFKCANGTEFEQTWEEGTQISGSKREDCSSESNDSSGGDNYPLPENWKNGILNKGWVLMKGSHAQDEKYQGAKDAIKFVQDKVGVKADGLFGPKTESAVEEYQDENSLNVDGKVGKNTLSKMLT